MILGSEGPIVKEQHSISDEKSPWQVFDEEIYPYLTVKNLYGRLQGLHNDGRYWEACCPIHEDIGGAFSIDSETLEWNCFLGCGGGGPVQFLQRVENLPWLEAARGVAEIAGVDASCLDEWLDTWGDEDFALHDRLEERSSLLGVFMAYARSLMRSGAGETLRRNLIQEHGFTEKQIESFGLGLYPVPEDLWHYLKTAGRELEEVRSWGLFDAKWTGCVVGAWRDVRGRTINVWGWHPREDRPGSAGAQGRLLFERNDRLGGKSVPFNLQAALGKRPRSVLLVDAPFTALLLQSLGIEDPFPLAVGGHLTRTQIEAMEKALELGGEIFLCWDHEPAAEGVKRDKTARSLELLKEFSLPVYAIDPGSLAHPGKPEIRVTVADFLHRHGMGVPARQAFDQVLSGREAQVSWEEPQTPFTDGSWPGVMDMVRRLSGHATNLPEGEPQQGSMAQLLDPLFRIADEVGRRVGNGFLKALPSGLVQGWSNSPSSEDLGPVAGEPLSALTSGEPPSFSVRRLEEETRMAPIGKYSAWQSLDQLGLRFGAGELTILAGGVSHGKTAFLLELLHGWLARMETSDETFLYYSTEEPEIRLYHRLVCLLAAHEGTHWNVRQVEEFLRSSRQTGEGDLSEELAVLERALSRLEGWEDSLQLIFQPSWSVVEIEKHARQRAAHGPLGGVLVDHLQGLLESGHSGPQLELHALARRFKNLAVELACPVLVCVQLAGRPNGSTLPQQPFDSGEMQAALRRRRPQLGELSREGNSLEADLVLGIHNLATEFEAEVTQPPRISEACPFEVGILKNRYGESGRWISLYLDRRSGQVRELQPMADWIVAIPGVRVEG